MIILLTLLAAAVIALLVVAFIHLCELLGNFLYDLLPVKTVCAWCGVVLHWGKSPITHGICVKCSEGVESDAL